MLSPDTLGFKKHKKQKKTKKTKSNLLIYLIDKIEFKTQKPYSLQPTKQMYQACQTGNFYVVKTLLATENPSHKDNLAIRVAYNNGHQYIVNLLMMDQRVDPSYILHQACLNNDFEMVKRIVNDSRFRPVDDDTGILIACENGYNDIVKFLLQKIRYNCFEIEDLLYKAASFKNIEIVREILKDKEYKPEKDTGYSTPISVAAKAGFYYIVQALLEDGRVDPTDNNNFALRIACHYGHADIVKLLLNDPRVDPNDLYDEGAIGGFSALKMACSRKAVGAVKVMLEDSRVKIDGITSDHPEIQEMLAARKYFPG